MIKRSTAFQVQKSRDIDQIQKPVLEQHPSYQKKKKSHRISQTNFSTSSKTIFFLLTEENQANSVRKRQQRQLYSHWTISNRPAVQCDLSRRFFYTSGLGRSQGAALVYTAMMSSACDSCISKHKEACV